MLKLNELLYNICKIGKSEFSLEVLTHKDKEGA